MKKFFMSCGKKEQLIKETQMHLQVKGKTIYIHVLITLEF